MSNVFIKSFVLFKNITTFAHMIIKIGFEKDGFLFGWHKGDLYRLPSESNKRTYPLKKLNTIKVGNKFGYHIKRKKMTIEQCRDLTCLLSNPLIITEHEDLPI